MVHGDVVHRDVTEVVGRAEGMRELEIGDRIHARRDLAFRVPGDLLPGRALSRVLHVFVAVLDPLVDGDDRDLTIRGGYLQLEAEVLLVRVDGVPGTSLLDADDAVQDRGAVER